MGERGLTLFKAIGAFGIRLVSNVSVERRESSHVDLLWQLLKAIHFPSGDQLIMRDRDPQVPGIRVEANFFQGRQARAQHRCPFQRRPGGERRSACRRETMLD